MVITNANTSHIIRSIGDSFRNKNITKKNTNIAKPCVSSDVQVSIDDQSNTITFNFIRKSTHKIVPKECFVVKKNVVGRGEIGFSTTIHTTYSTSIPHT